jgi:hypothetical protein
LSRKRILLSVHVPKTGGTSFSATLADVYGQKLVEDNPWLDQREPLLRNGPMNISRVEILSALEHIDCIHGHYPIAKYLPLQQVAGVDAVFVTWLRDPVQRALSVYHFLRTHDAYPPDEQPEWERDAKTLDLEDFLEKWIKDDPVSQQVGTSIRTYSFVGITERFNESMHLFTRTIIGSEDALPIRYERRTPGKNGSTWHPTARAKNIILRNSRNDLALYGAAQRWMDRQLRLLEN